MTLPGLQAAWLGRHWEHFATLPSTNDYCKRNADALPHGAAVTAELQTGGKGRLGKRWNEEPGKGLALSLLLREPPMDFLRLLPLISGLAVAEALDELCGVPCGLKWSNDVLLEGKKLCGILCESRIGSDGAFAVVGIGVNLAHTLEDFQRLGLVYATSLLLATKKNYPAAETAAAILNRLEPLLEQFLAQGFGPILPRYKARCVNLGKPVRVLWQDSQREGVALDIAEDGSLLCELDGEIRPITAGEASVRGLLGYAD